MFLVLEQRYVMDSKGRVLNRITGEASRWQDRFRHKEILGFDADSSNYFSEEILNRR